MCTDLLQHIKSREEKMIPDTLHTTFYSKNIQWMIQSVHNIESDKINKCECTHTKFVATTLTFCALSTCAHRNAIYSEVVKGNTAISRYGKCHND